MSTSELYEFHGPNFKTPILLTWHDVIAEFKLHPDVPLLKIQRTAIKKYLLFLGAEFREDSWWLPEQASKSVIVISMRTDPEEVLEWVPMQADIPREQDYQDPFIDAYTKSPFAVIRDNLLAELVWQSFVKFMAHRLLNEQEPIDLFFARIVPLQIRSDWKAVATAWEAGNVSNGRFNPNPDSIIKRGVADLLASDYMTGVIKGPGRTKTDGEGNLNDPFVPHRDSDSPVFLLTANWTIEIIPNEKWDQMAKNLEMNLSPHMGNHLYWHYLVKTRLLSQLKNTIEVYAHYLKKAVLPSATIRRDKFHCVAGLSPAFKLVDAGKRFKNPYSLAGNNPVKPVPIPSGAKEALEGEDAGLPEMSTVQSDTQIMRNSREYDAGL